MAKRRRGRPVKDEADKWGPPVVIRLDPDTGKALVAFVDRERFASRSEAIRRLLRQALRQEGLL